MVAFDNRMFMWHFVVLVVTLLCAYGETDSQSATFPEHKVHSHDHIHAHLGKFVSAINASIDDVVDAKLHDMSKVYHTGNICPFRRTVVSKMAKTEKIKIVIVGGSVTYGAELRDRMNQRWSAYFTELMNSGWYQGQFEVVNIGVGACNIDVWIDKVSMVRDADLVIMDLSVNDQGFDLQALPHLYAAFIQLVDAQDNHPAFLFHQAFRTGLRDPREFGHCPIREYQGSCCNGFLWCKRWWDMQDFVTLTLARFSIPYVSYRDLIWPVYNEPPPVLDQWWNGMSHPDYKAHKMMAKLIAFGVMMQVKEAHAATHCDNNEEHSRYVSSSAIDKTVQPICATPKTFLYTGETPESVQNFPAVLSDGTTIDTVVSSASTGSTGSGDAVPHTPWRYYNDSQLKFGWILALPQAEIERKCDGAKYCTKVVEESVLSFKLKFGEFPRLQISYLKSQDASMGTIKVRLSFCCLFLCLALGNCCPFCDGLKYMLVCD